MDKLRVLTLKGTAPHKDTAAPSGRAAPAGRADPSGRAPQAQAQAHIGVSVPG